jgi:hypothetical protein
MRFVAGSANLAAFVKAEEIEQQLATEGWSLDNAFVLSNQFKAGVGLSGFE